jgi:putative ABC transport system permease protein
VLHLSIKNLLAHKRRLIGTALSVVIGIAFLAGTFVLTDTIGRTFDDLFANVFEKTDAYVRSSHKIEMDQGTVYERIPDTIVDKVRAVDGVAEAQGNVGGSATIIGKNGKAITTQGAPTLAGDIQEGPLSPWRLKPGGRYPHGANEATIDAASAKKGKLVVGDTVHIVSQGGGRDFTLVGIMKFGSTDSPGGATYAAFDLPTAQSFVGTAGQLDAVLVRAKSGISQDALVQRVKTAVDGDTQVITGKAITAETQSDIRKGLSFFSVFLRVFAFIALFVGSFIIYNTFSIIVAQRQRETALLRAIGAGRRQVIGSILLESIGIGVFASIIGFLVGIVMAVGLKALLSAVGIGIPAGGLVVLPRTLIVSLLVGVLITVIAAVFPSIRASRIPPVAAMRDVSVDRAGRSRGRLIAGGIVTALGIGGVALGLTGTGIGWLGLGAGLLFIGLFILGPLVARPVAGLLGSPLPRVKGITGELAKENATRNPTRTARTAAALMVGVALVAGISVMAASLRSSIRNIFGEQFTGDLVVNDVSNRNGGGGLPLELANRIGQLPEIKAATGVQVKPAVINGQTKMLSVTDAAKFTQVFDFEFLQGDPTKLSADGVLVSKKKADADHLSLGSTVDMTMLDGSKHTLTVQGIYKKDQLAGAYTVSKAFASTIAGDNFDFAVFATKKAGVSDAQLKAAVAPIVKDYPNGEVKTRKEYIDQAAKGIDTLLNLIYALLFLAVAIAVMGISNTLNLSIVERTRELGLIRAVGAFKSQVRETVRWESVITALLGAVEGIVVGVLLGYAVIVALRSQGLKSFTMPYVTLLVLLVLAVLAGIVAARRPAKKAAKLDILQAIATD